MKFLVKEFLASVSGKPRIRLVVCSGLVLTWCLLSWHQTNNRRLRDPSDVLLGGYRHSVYKWGGACWADMAICCGPPWLFLVTNPEERHPSVRHTCWNIHSGTAHNSPKLGTTISHWEGTTHNYALWMSLTYNIERCQAPKGTIPSMSSTRDS